MNVWGLVRMGITSRTSSDGENDAIKGTPGPPGSQAGQDQCGRYYPWGFDSRVPDGARALLVAPEGSSANLALVGAVHDKHQPDYADENWTQTIYNEVAGTWVKLRKDGGIQVGAKDSLFELKADGSFKLTAADGANLEFKADGTGKWTSATGGTIEMQAAGVISFNGGNSNVIREGDGVLRNLALKTWMTQVEVFTGAAVTPFVGERIGTSLDGNPKVHA